MFRSTRRASRLSLPMTGVVDRVLKVSSLEIVQVVDVRPPLRLLERGQCGPCDRAEVADGAEGPVADLAIRIIDRPHQRRDERPGLGAKTPGLARGEPADGPIAVVEGRSD